MDRLHRYRFAPPLGYSGGVPAITPKPQTVAGSSMPAHRSATRDELFAFGQNYAVGEEERRKRELAKKRPVDDAIEKLVDKYLAVEKL